MEKLFDAARRGNVEELRLLMKANPVILQYVALESRENPLHVACMFGHLEFAREMLTLKPEFAKKLNQIGYSPLHLASANGHREIVKLLITSDRELCRLRGVDFITPLHSAALADEIGVIDEILSVCPECIQDVTISGQTALHLAVNSSQYESLRILVNRVKSMNKEEIFDVKDEQDNTAESLAVQLKDRRALKIMRIDVALTTDIENNNTQDLSRSILSQDSRRSSPGMKEYSMFHKSILVIAVLVATTAFQIVLSPPGGVWQDNNVIVQTNDQDGSKRMSHPGESVLATYNPGIFYTLIVLNSCAFVFSTAIIMSLSSKFPLRSELYICFGAAYSTYIAGVKIISPVETSRFTLLLLTGIVPIFALLFLQLVKKLLKRRMRT